MTSGTSSQQHLAKPPAPVQRQPWPMATRWRQTLSHTGRLLRAVISSPASGLLRPRTLPCGCVGVQGVASKAEGQAQMHSAHPYEAWHLQETGGPLLPQTLNFSLSLAGFRMLTAPRKVVQERRHSTLHLLDLLPHLVSPPITLSLP